MEYLQAWFQSSEWPIWSALLLGLMTAISPCPLTTNIVAIGYISKSVEKSRKVLFSGLVYILGRAVSYTFIGVLFFFGASQFKIAGALQQWGEKILGPLVIIIGVFMLGLIKITIPGFSNLNSKTEKWGTSGYWKVFLLGVVFALAFCPYSGVLYFGMLIPMTISHAQGLVLPIFYAIGTSIPVIIFAFVIAFSMQNLNNLFTSLKNFEYWFRKVVAVLFIGAGTYLTYITWIN